jgi:hypothetical protein
MISEPPIDPATQTVVELVDGLRAGARGSYPSEAAVELLIRHWTWLARPDFLRDCVFGEDASALAVRWWRLVELAPSDDVEPANRAIALFATQLGGFPEPAERPVDLEQVGPSRGCSRPSRGATSAWS